MTLHFAQRDKLGDSEVMNALFSAKKWSHKFKDTNSKLLKLLQQTGNVEKFEALLARKPSIDLNSLRFVSDFTYRHCFPFTSGTLLQDGWPPLHIACLYGHVGLVQYLINNLKLNVFQTRDEPTEPLKYSIQADKLLDDSKCAVLHILALTGQLELVKLVIKKGARISEATTVQFFYVGFLTQ